MEDACVVRLLSHPRPFLIRDRYCRNPDCRCHVVSLDLMEISESGELLANPLCLTTDVDLETWEEIDIPERTPEAGALVREFLEGCSAEMKTRCREQYAEEKRIGRRMARYTVDPQEVLAGALISYSDLLTDEGSLTSGGSGYTYDFSYQGREFLIEDRYCCNPNCKCRKVELEFFESVKDGGGDPSRSRTYFCFRADVRFKGRPKLLECGECSRQESQAVLTAWWQEYRGELKLFESRYMDVKEIGRRNLETADKAPGGIRQLSSEPANDRLADLRPNRSAPGGTTHVRVAAERSSKSAAGERTPDEPRRPHGFVRFCTQSHGTRRGWFVVRWRASRTADQLDPRRCCEVKYEY